jgi:hypothetical protein
MNLSLDEIRNHYKKFPNHKIEQIAGNKDAKISEEVLIVLIEEIKKRNLSSDLLSTIKTEFKTIRKNRIDEIRTIIESLNCPECGSYNKIQSVEINETVSMLLLSKHNKRIFIACEECIKKEKKSVLFKNLFLGLWSLQGLFYYTPLNLFRAFWKGKNQSEHSRKQLDNYIYENIENLTDICEDKAALFHFIQKTNNQKKLNED